jgi:putative IMPACT (imprinted ancient) family translation regulator
VLIVVVRYFGGKLLGASGLIQAYRESAADALRQASIKQITVTTSYLLTFDYAIMGTLMDALNRYGASIDGKRLDANPALRVSLPMGQAEQQIDQIVAATLGRHIEEVAGKRKFDLLHIKTIADS